MYYKLHSDFVVNSIAARMKINVIITLLNYFQDGRLCQWISLRTQTRAIDSESSHLLVGNRKAIPRTWKIQEQTLMVLTMWELIWIMKRKEDFLWGCIFGGCVFVFFIAIPASLHQNQNGLKPVITVHSIQVIKLLLQNCFSFFWNCCEPDNMKLVISPSMSFSVCIKYYWGFSSVHPIQNH